MWRQAQGTQLPATHSHSCPSAEPQRRGTRQQSTGEHTELLTNKPYLRSRFLPALEVQPDKACMPRGAEAGAQPAPTGTWQHGSEPQDSTAEPGVLDRNDRQNLGVKHVYLQRDLSQLWNPRAADANRSFTSCQRRVEWAGLLGLYKSHSTKQTIKPSSPAAEVTACSRNTLRGLFVQRPSTGHSNRAAVIPEVILQLHCYILQNK